MMESKGSESASQRPIWDLPLGFLRLVVEGVVYLLLIGGCFTLGWTIPADERFAVLAMLIPALYTVLIVAGGYWRKQVFPNANGWLLLGGVITLWSLFYLLPINVSPRLPGVGEAEAAVATAAPTLNEAMAGQGIEEPVRMVALDPYKTPKAVRHLIAWVGLTLALLHIVRRRDPGLRVFYFLALFGLLQGLLGAASLVDAEAPFATGSFYNRNHFGALMAMLWPIMFATLRVLHLRGSGRFSRPILSGENPLLLLGGLLLLATIGFIASTSRGAVLIGGTAIIGYIVHEQYIRARKQASIEYDMGIARSRSPLQKALVGVAQAGAFLALLAVIVFLVEVRGRDHAFDVNRIDIWQAALAGLSDHWFLGVGPGGGHRLLDLYAVQLSDTPMIYAHSEWLEVLLEFGLLGSLALGGLTLATLMGTAKTWRKYPVPSLRTVSTVRRAAGWGCIAALGVGVAEFHLRIPSIQIVFSMLLALWVSFSYSSEVKRYAGKRQKKNA